MFLVILILSNFNKSYDVATECLATEFLATKCLATECLATECLATECPVWVQALTPGMVELEKKIWFNKRFKKGKENVINPKKQSLQ